MKADAVILSASCEANMTKSILFKFADEIDHCMTDDRDGLIKMINKYTHAYEKAEAEFTRDGARLDCMTSAQLRARLLLVRNFLLDEAFAL